MPFRGGNVRWAIIGLVMTGTVINYLTRSVLSVAAPSLMATFHISEKEYGFITGVFQLGIMLQGFAGYILDLIQLRLGMTLFAIGWGIVLLAQTFASSWTGFAWLRGLQGFVEGVAQPGGLKVVAEWFPAKERGFAGGIYNIGASIGSMLAPPLVAWAILTYDWRMAFFVASGLAFVWAGLWYAFYERPARHKRLSAQELAHIQQGQESALAVTSERTSFWNIVKQRNFWGVALPRFLADPTWGTLVFWMPLYLSQARGMDIKSIALYGWLPFVAADMGCLFGPALALWLQQRGIDLINARRSVFTFGALLMTTIVFVGSVTSPVAAVALLCLAACAHQTLSVTVITMSSDLFRTNEVATAAGMAGAAGNLGAMLFSVAIGLLVLKVGYGPFFMVLGGLDLVGALLLWSLVKPPALVQEP